MKAPLLLCGVLCCGLLLTGCRREIRKLHIEKRIYRPGWYVSIPTRGEPITHSYPPPAQTPVSYPVPVPAQRTTSTTSTLPSPSLPSPPRQSGSSASPKPPLLPSQTSAPTPPRPDSAASPAVTQPPAVVPDSSGSKKSVAVAISIDLKGGFQVFAAGLLPASRYNFPLMPGAGYTGGGYTLVLNTGSRIAVLASCSYRYVRLPVKHAPLRPLPLPQTTPDREKIRLHTLCSETSFRISLSDEKFINSIDAGVGIEQIFRSVYMSKSRILQPLPGSGKESYAATKTKVTGLYGFNARSCYITGGVSHAGWRIFFTCRINRQTIYETDFQRVAIGLMFSTN
jgi:hypothetical protein